MKKGLLVVLSGASSVGKNKIRDLLLQDSELKLFYSVSMTTRPQKADEVDGKDYYFVNHELFAQAVKNKELLEFTEFNGYYYGTPRKNIDFLLDHGKHVLVEVEAQGVGQIKLLHPEAIAFFVVPESMEELEKQIRLRYKDNEQTIQQRLSKAAVEMELAPLFQNTVKSTDALAAKESIRSVILRAMNGNE